MSPHKEVTESKLQADPSNRIGTFIVLNTLRIKGLRLNLDDIRTYCKAGTELNTIQLSYKNNGGTILDYRTEKDAEEVIDLLDSYCL